MLLEENKDAGVGAHPPVQIDGSTLLVCDLGHGLSEFCTKAFQE